MGNVSGILDGTALGSHARTPHGCWPTWRRAQWRRRSDGVVGGRRASGGFRIACHPTMQHVSWSQIPTGAGYSEGCWSAQVHCVGLHRVSVTECVELRNWALETIAANKFNIWAEIWQNHLSTNPFSSCSGAYNDIKLSSSADIELTQFSQGFGCYFGALRSSCWVYNTTTSDQTTPTDKRIWLKVQNSHQMDLVMKLRSQFESSRSRMNHSSSTFKFFEW